MFLHRCMRVSGLCSALVMGIGLSVAGADTITLTGTIRDFKDSHPDFESLISVDPGIVEMTLGADKKPVYAGLAGNPTTHGKIPFDQWYRDVPGVNLSKSHSIVLDNTITPDPAIYTFSDSTFFPIDGDLFGNEGRSHNYHFTYELHSAFTYKGGEVFTFTGDDDLWVFINDKLAIDLGGVHGAMTKTVDLDAMAATLGITPGGLYDFDLFFAERHTVASTFRIDTSLALVHTTPVPLPVAGWSGLALLGGLGTLRKFRRRCGIES